MKDTITILQTDQPLTKTFTMVQGNIEKNDYGNAYEYQHSEFPLDNIMDLAEIILELGSWTNACVIRGQLRKGVNPEQPVLRRKDAYDDKKAYYQEKETGKHWGCFDFDKVPAPDYLHTMEDRLLYLVSLLGPEFYRKTFVYQWSSSAGIKGWDTLSCHLWYWLEEPRTDTSMGLWSEQNGYVDDAPFRTVQPNYTAKPIFNNMEDPLGQDRSGIYPYNEHSVLIPKVKPLLVKYNTEGKIVPCTKSFEQRLQEIGPRYHMKIQKAIASHVATYGRTTDFQGLKALIRNRINVAPAGTASKDVYTNDRYLDQSIRGAIRKFGQHTPTKMDLVRKELRKM